jgi:hypothetical protein
MSIVNTRMPPGESLMRAGAGGGGASPCSAEVSWVLSGAFGMISGCRLALGAKHALKADQMQPAMVVEG